MTIIKLFNLEKEYGDKGSTSTSVNLSTELRNRVDEVLEGQERARSAWVERAAELLLALQTGEMAEWVEWVATAVGSQEAGQLLANRLSELASMVDWAFCDDEELAPR